ncbi:CorA family divalent cation transporter [Novosphingobium album (ex Liu et al. 2023)]|uniref:CorA family divalent cation transporter n=1 Tax=Novosphingobium album (ex Liu et al. 2023) TaxID=3031130 RepID=A0ABT5WVN0_9SPHN|nr:CorA family divalent cation transporter [Novosphingobium album (ex Liu et al. 2023)]MDE8653958.1 CorA family divalent cation transporter [Novosphingobium album (ex Liu et al. 2023)]
MTDERMAGGGASVPATGPGLIWGIDFAPGERRDVENCNSPHRGFLRWLHLNLADHGTRLWIETTPELPQGAREVLLSQDSHQRALVERKTVACVLHDFERDFDVRDTGRVGALRVALTPTLIVSARVHPIGSADITRRRLDAIDTVDGPARALDLIVSAILENIGRVIASLSAEVQAAEDALIDERHVPSGRRLLEIRRRLAQLHRMLEGTHGVLHRLELDHDLPHEMLPTAEKLAQRVQGVDGDTLSVTNQLRLLRDELDHQQNQKINQNLFLLSVMTALMLPSTLVTGIFGMNTGGLPLTGHFGTLGATLIAIGAAGATYLFLKSQGFFR